MSWDILQLKHKLVFDSKLCKRIFGVSLQRLVTYQLTCSVRQ